MKIAWNFWARIIVYEQIHNNKRASHVVEDMS